MNLIYIYLASLLITYSLEILTLTKIKKNQDIINKLKKEYDLWLKSYKHL